MLDVKVVIFAENINEPFAHIAINATLDGIIDGRDTTFDLKKDIKEPFGVGIKMLPMGYEHVITHRFVAVIHRLLEGGDILRGTLLYNLTEHFPVFSDMIISILLRVADSPMTGNREYDVVFLKEFL
jgi:hypothetical protein